MLSPESPTYYIVVWDPKGEYGGYVIGYGRAEKWVWKDLVPTIKAVIEVQKGHWMGERGSLTGSNLIEENDSYDKCRLGWYSGMESGNGNSVLNERASSGLSINLFGVQC